MKQFAFEVGLAVLLLAACAPAPTATPIPFTPTPPPLVASGVEGLQIQTVCLGVGVRYPQLEQKISPPPIEASLTFVLTELGMKVQPWQESCQTWIGFSVVLQALKQNYFKIGECFTGASATVFTTLNLPEHKPIEKQFTGGLLPPLTTSLCPGIGQAPFGKGWQ